MEKLKLVFRRKDDNDTDAVGVIQDIPEITIPADGYQAWIQVLVGHLMFFNAFGYINSYGVFESYYVDTLRLSPSIISWTGSVQAFLLFSIGIFSGRLFDAGHLTSLVVVGCFLQVLGVFMTSLCQEYWQFFLAQGICGGLGAGIAYTPVLACVSTYFTRKKALAVSVTTCGSVTGGVVFPVIARELLGRVGFAWTVRVMGFVMLFNSVVIVVLAKARLPPRKRGPLVEVAAFKEASYTLFSIGVFLLLWGVYISYYYISHYATEILHVDNSTSIVLLLLMNGLGLPGRIIPALVSDAYLGPFKTLIPLALASGVLYLSWIRVDSTGGVFAIAVLFGLVNGGVQAMSMAGLPFLTADLSKVGTRSGMVLSIVSVAALTGPPIAGALIEAGGGSYVPLQAWTGVIMIAGGGFVAAARLANRRLMKRNADADALAVVETTVQA
ncbi:major facilitator superfamily domain-containing protein [Coniochaeta sp. 2T2.1]|nr:major facilitator superfamily domain-containing protein [Coniochaeta sp. 2T2.1]